VRRTSWLGLARRGGVDAHAGAPLPACRAVDAEAVSVGTAEVLRDAPEYESGDGGGGQGSQHIEADLECGSNAVCMLLLGGGPCDTSANGTLHLSTRLRAPPIRK
jgi:hypothetical protein